MLKRMSRIAVLAAAVVSTAAFCQQAAVVQVALSLPPPGPVGQFDAVVVTGKVSGPGMWHVYKDDAHDLWILGTVQPLPASMQWDADMVGDMVMQAQEVLWYPGYSVNVKANIFQQAMLGFGFWRAQGNPGGKSLKDVLDPALYARWQAAKAIYLPGNSGVENKRPLIAAGDLLDAAIEHAGLSGKYSFYKVMKSAMDAAGVRSNYPQFKVDVSNASAKAAIADLRGTSLDDARCLAATLDAIDADVPHMVANANAWARGDVAHISYALLAKRDSLCADSMMSPEFSAKYGIPNIERSTADLWVKEAQAALDRNPVTVAFVPMEHLTPPDNLLDRLRAQGYTVMAP